MHTSFQRPRSIVLILAGTLSALATVQAQTMTPDGTATSRVTVTGEAVPSPTPNREDYKAKLDHIMKEVSGTEITVTKKATVIKLDQQPTIVNNNLQEEFTKAPAFSSPTRTPPASTISAIAAWVTHRNQNL